MSLQLHPASIRLSPALARPAAVLCMHPHNWQWPQLDHMRTIDLGIQNFPRNNRLGQQRWRRPTSGKVCKLVSQGFLIEGGICKHIFALLNAWSPSLRHIFAVCIQFREAGIFVCSNRRPVSSLLFFWTCWYLLLPAELEARDRVLDRHTQPVRLHWSRDLGQPSRAAERWRCSRNLSSSTAELW